MAFVAQNAGGKFVAWGDKKAKENSYIVKEGENITGKVLKIKDSNTYGKILEVKSKESEEPLIITGTTILIRELGYIKDDKGKFVPSSSVKPVKEGDIIRITFKGMIKTKRGKDAYDLMVEVDR